jgi:DNA-binding GntR family transcriptional regulator
VLNASLGRRSTTPDQALAIDSEWHALLLSAAPFQHLAETTDRLKRLLRRYEHAYMRRRTHVAKASEQHQAIVAELRHGRLSRASKLLEENWLIGIEPMRAWLDAQVVPVKEKTRRASRG